jgi:hypothetical protein
MLRRRRNRKTTRAMLTWVETQYTLPRMESRHIPTDWWTTKTGDTK